MLRFAVEGGPARDREGDPVSGFGYVPLLEMVHVA